MGTGEGSDDIRAERAARMDAARQRAGEAGDRAEQLRRDQLRAREPAGSTRGSSADDLADSARLAAQAEEHLIRAFERGATAHDRAARLHEQQAANEQTTNEQTTNEQTAGHRAGPGTPDARRPPTDWGTGSDTEPAEPADEGRDHLVRAQEHRLAAAADRDRATAARNRRDAPAG